MRHTILRAASSTLVALSSESRAGIEVGMARHRVWNAQRWTSTLVEVCQSVADVTLDRWGCSRECHSRDGQNVNDTSQFQRRVLLNI